MSRRERGVGEENDNKPHLAVTLCSEQSCVSLFICIIIPRTLVAAIFHIQSYRGMYSAAGYRNMVLRAGSVLAQEL